MPFDSMATRTHGGQNETMDIRVCSHFRSGCRVHPRISANPCATDSHFYPRVNVNTRTTDRHSNSANSNIHTNLNANSDFHTRFAQVR
jgi:hypothetical protein